jgi:hypothetical protein
MPFIFLFMKRTIEIIYTKDIRMVDEIWSRAIV